MPVRPAAVAFDVLGTVAELEPLGTELGKLGLPPEALQLWFVRTQRDGFALSAAGEFRPFREVAAATLRGMLAGRGGPVDPTAIAAAIGRFAALPAYPDVAPAVDRLRAAGVRVLALTNGGADATNAMLAANGLSGRFERVVSIDEVGVWKPRAEVYLRAARAAGLEGEPGHVALIASHAWDCHGARRAGLATGWVRRPGQAFDPIFGRPDAEGDTLDAVAEALLALPAA